MFRNLDLWLIVTHAAELCSFNTKRVICLHLTSFVYFEPSEWTKHSAETGREEPIEAIYSVVLGVAQSCLAMRMQLRRESTDSVKRNHSLAEGMDMPPRI